MTGADESCIKEGISVVRKEYSVLKEDMKLHECGWSHYFIIHGDALTILCCQLSVWFSPLGGHLCF
jgi:hypothetical protein